MESAKDPEPEKAMENAHVIPRIREKIAPIAHKDTSIRTKV